METKSPVKKYSDSSWTTGLRLQADIWIYEDHLTWYADAEPQFRDGYEYKKTQTDEEFLTYGPPVFIADFFNSGILKKVERVIKRRNKKPAGLNLIRQNILNEVGKNKKITLEGNKEYFEIMEFQEKNILLYGGDTMTNREEYRKTIDEKMAFNKIKDYCVLKARNYDYTNITTDSELFDFVQKHKFI